MIAAWVAGEGRMGMMQVILEMSRHGEEALDNTSLTITSGGKSA